MQFYAHVITLLLSILLALVPGLEWLIDGPAAAQPQTIARTLQLPGSGIQVLEISNINGSIHIVAEDRRDVAVVATRTRGDGATSDVEAAVDFRQSGDRMLVCGDRERCGCHLDSRVHHDNRDRTRVDFDVRVPRLVTLDVCTVNGGSVRVEGSEGPYTLRNVNGDIDMAGVSGSGRAVTVNGHVTASFTAAPSGPLELKTVNGPVDVSFPPNLSADLQMTTRNGGLYTDFDSAPLAARAATGERRDGVFRYRSDRFARVRIGNGGPALTFQTLNGDIRVHKPTP